MLGVVRLSNLIGSKPDRVIEMATRYQVDFVDVRHIVNIEPFSEEVRLVQDPDRATVQFGFGYPVDSPTVISADTSTEDLAALHATICDCISDSDDYKITVLIEKTVSQNGKFTIYDYDAFAEWFMQWPTRDHFSLLNKCLHHIGQPVVECTFPNNERKELIFDCGANRSTDADGFTRARIVQKMNMVANLESFEEMLVTPWDLCVVKHSGIDDAVLEKLQRECSMLSLAYIANRAINSSDTLRFEIKGIDFVSSEYSSSDHHLADQSAFDLASWIYIGGEIFDKIEIARNFLSMQKGDEVLPVLPETTSAIDRNYQIYLTNNVKEYLHARNELANSLQKYSQHIAESVASLVNDLKANLVGIASCIGALLIARQMENPQFNYFDGLVGEMALIVAFVSLVFGFVSFFLCRKRAEFYKAMIQGAKISAASEFSPNEMIEMFEDSPQYKESCRYLEVWSRSLLCIWILLCSILIFAIDYFAGDTALFGILNLLPLDHTFNMDELLSAISDIRPRCPLY